MEKDLRKASKQVWTSPTEMLSVEQINCGSLLRIADAIEITAKNNQQLIDTANFYKERSQSKQTEIDSLLRSNAALRGHIKRLKNSLKQF
jgi:hypothetical protein